MLSFFYHKHYSCIFSSQEESAACKHQRTSSPLYHFIAGNKQLFKTPAAFVRSDFEHSVVICDRCIYFLLFRSVCMLIILLLASSRSPSLSLCSPFSERFLCLYFHPRLSRSCCPRSPFCSSRSTAPWFTFDGPMIDGLLLNAHSHCTQNSAC